MPNNNDNYEYMKFLDLSGAQQIWNTCKQTFVQTVNGVGIDANGNCQVPGADALSIYPVGSIYMSVNNTSPASLFGGTWTQIKDVFLLGAGDTYSNGATGGEATHTLIENEMPSHNHSLWLVSSGATYRSMNYQAPDLSEKWLPITSGRFDDTTSAGGGQAHNNMPPYLTVYMWKRTA